MKGSHGKREIPISNWASWKQIGAFVLAAAVCACGAGAATNPYGIAGTGVLTKLGMPPDCSEYDWNNLQPSNPINMVQSCKDWISGGGTHQFWGYHEITDTIDNPTQFASWVTAHPGKTWIISNEPDGLDYLTADQYARMFHCYYTFIKPLDPTARFAIGALSGQYNAAGLAYLKNWYQPALTSYQTQFGTNMPIDIWNFHEYCPGSQTEDPDRIINELVTPFIQWCHTVQGGAYASCPVWITECPVSVWIDALSPENMIAFMQLYMPRLEQAGIEKWFWFVSNDWDGNLGSCALTDQSGQVTSVGAAYAALANSYPNAVPPIVPFVPLPTPETVLFDFSGAFGPPWFNKAGWWSNTNGELRHTGIYPLPGTVCCPLYVYQDFGLSFRMKINSAPADVNWAGVLLRPASRMHSHADSGYLFFVRKNGDANLYNKVDGIVASVPGAVADPTAYHSYQAYVSGFHITCYIDGVKRIDWTDPNSRYASGYVSVQTYKADSSFDDLALAKFPRPTPVIADDGVYTTNLTALHAAWDVADTNQTGFQYSVGLSAGATNVVPWTITTDKTATLALTLIPSWTYYVNVQAVYPGGIRGPMASTDGITAQAGTASHFGAVTLTSIPTLSGDTTNDARAITPDGRWVVGASGSRGFLHAVNTLGVSNVVGSDGAQSTILTGVGYRTNLSAQQEIIVSGLCGGSNTVWMTANGGAVWGPRVSAAAIKITTVPVANGLAGTASNAFYTVWTDEGAGANDNWQLNVGQFSNAWPATVAWGAKSATKPNTLQLNGISSNGRSVGWRRNGSSLAYSNYVADWQGATTPALWSFNGLSGTAAGQAYAVSADGTIIFGLSPKGVATGSTNYGYKAVFSATMPGPAIQLSTSPLPSFPDTAGSSNLAIPYGCTADGKFAVGMNYRGRETAVLWDTSDADTNKWTVTDLTALAAANGSLGYFTNLSCAYSIGMSAFGEKVIAGVGVDTGNNTRAFVMSIPPVVRIASAPDKYTFSIQSVTGMAYYLEYTTNLAPAVWDTLGSTPGTGGIVTLTNLNPTASQRFYRVRIQ